MRETAVAAARETGLVTLAHPEWLLWLLPVVAVAIAIAARTRPAALAWPALAEARAAGARRFDAVRGLSLAMSPAFSVRNPGRP